MKDIDFVDRGLNKKLIEDVQEGKYNDEETLKTFSNKHRKLVREQHNLGFKSHLKPKCSACGHRICRCKDRKARYELENGSLDGYYGSDKL